MFEKESKEMCKDIQKCRIFSVVQLYILLDKIVSDFVEELRRSGIPPDPEMPSSRRQNLEQ
jgi:hypothetical protein